MARENVLIPAFQYEPVELSALKQITVGSHLNQCKRGDVIPRGNVLYDFGIIAVANDSDSVEYYGVQGGRLEMERVDSVMEGIPPSYTPTTWTYQAGESISIIPFEKLPALTKQAVAKVLSGQFG